MTAAAAADTEQAVSQRVAVDDPNDSVAPEQWSGQQITLDQRVSAGASGAQTGARNTQAIGTNAGTADAAAVAAALAGQDAAQAALAGQAAVQQWVGELTDVTQSVGAIAHTGQHGLHNGGTAKAVSSGTAVSISEQSSRQTAVGLAGLGSQTVRQLIIVDQLAAAGASTQDGLSGLPTGRASSDAGATDAALIDELAVQNLVVTGGIGIQDLTQNVFAQQRAQATSTSFGGTGGHARAVNCTTVEQASAQGLDAPASASATDLSDFCWAPLPAEEPKAAAPAAAAAAAGAAQLIPGPLGPQLAPSPAAPRALPAPRQTRPGRLTGVAVARAAHVPALVLPATGSVAGARFELSKVSVPTVTASPSGHAGSVAEHDQQEPSLLWLPGLLGGAAFPAQASPGGSGAAWIAAHPADPVLPESWWMNAGQAVRRSGSLFFLRLPKPG